MQRNGETRRDPRALAEGRQAESQSGSGRLAEMPRHRARLPCARIARSFAEMIDAALLALLVCPLTHQSLRLATREELARFQLDAALVREDGRVAYPIRDGIPVLIPEAAVPGDSPAAAGAGADDPKG